MKKSYRYVRVLIIIKKIFKEKIKHITVPEKGKLRFLFNDGERIEKTWEYPSRKESWTEEMKKLAKNKCSLRRRRKDYSFNFSNQEKIK